MASFYGWGSFASRLEPLWGGSLLFTTKFSEIPGTRFINLRRMKGWADLGATQWFWTWGLVMTVSNLSNQNILMENNLYICTEKQKVSMLKSAIKHVSNVECETKVY